MSTTTTEAFTGRTQIDGGNCNSLGNGSANALSEVDNHAGSLGFFVDFSLTCASAPSSGNTIAFYLITAPDTGAGTGPHASGTYTDSIAPAATGVTLVNALPIKTYTVNTSSPYTIADTFALPVPFAPPYWTLVVKNSSGVALASSGNSVSVTPFAYSSQ
jgi:hypothetical protein